MSKYDDEFKREAARELHDGQPVASVARALGCAERLPVVGRAVGDDQAEAVALQPRSCRHALGLINSRLG